jgi:multidrug efflux pump subunit AcrA (membrane-fusion protein)
MVKRLIKNTPTHGGVKPGRKSKIRPLPWILLGYILIILPAISGCVAGMREAPTPTPLPLVVEQEKILFTVERGQILSQREITGEVIPAVQEQLFFRAKGYVMRIAVNAGDLVEKGQVLAELQLDDLLEQLEQAQIDLEVAQDNYTNEQLQRDYDIKKARAEVSIWENQVELANEQYQRATGLEKRNAQINLENAEVQLETARAWLNLVENKIATYLEQDVRRKALSVERLERLVAERQIIAPFDGIVLKNNLYAGSEIEAFASAVLIGDPDTLVIRTPIDSELSKILSEDTRVYLVGKSEQNSSTEDGSTPKEQLYPIQYIPELLPVSEKKEGITVRGDDISLNFHYFRIPPDTPVEQLPILRAVLVRVILGEKENALLVNPAGIRGIDQFKYVIVLDGDLHRRVEIVQIGLKTTDKWEITGDLQPGDQVLGP